MTRAWQFHRARIQGVGLLAIVLALACWGRLHAAAIKVEPPASDTVVYESRERPDMLDEHCPQGIRVVQISKDPGLFSHHMYPEAHMFTPDSKRFIFHRRKNEKDDIVIDSYWLCDILDNFSVRKIIDEPNAGAPSVTPDGQWAYYRLFDPTERVMQLKRVSLKTFQRETLASLKGVTPGWKHEVKIAGRPTSISSDGKRLCTPVSAIGDSEDAIRGILVWDLETLAARIVFVGDYEYCNMHLQYCRSLDPVLSHDIMVQHNHGVQYDSAGKVVMLTSGDGADLHVLRDDGTHWRDVPVGRDGKGYNTGHEQWRGKMPSVVSSVKMFGKGGLCRLYEALPIPTDAKTSHRGSKIPGAKPNNLTRTVPETNFGHFCMDASGMHLVASHDEYRGKYSVKLYLATFSPGDNASLKVQYLLDTGWRELIKGWVNGQNDKPRPVMSPDANVVLFHTDRDGKSEIFLVDRYILP